MITACRKCRRASEKLLLKGEKCLSPNCSLTKRPYAPGQHGQSFRGKISEYGRQLAEKQKARCIYNVLEAQFAGYVKKADTMQGNKSENLLKLLESRIDNVIFRLGFAPSRSAARQYVSHEFFNLNGHKVKTASLQVKPGDVIEIRKKDYFKEVKLNSAITWIDVDSKKMKAEIKHLPTREEIDTNINESLIIEFYSR